MAAIPSIDEAEVQRLIREAQDDCAVNLLEPLWAFVHIAETKRHHQRFIQVMGMLAGAKSWVKSTGVVLLVIAGILTALILNDEFGIVPDLLFAAAFGALLGYLSRVFLTYQEAFAKVYTVERRDFTDPSQVTGVSLVYLPRLGFANRPEVWRGNNGRNGIRDRDAFVVLQMGIDAVAFDPAVIDEPYIDESHCTVIGTGQISELRTPQNYYPLPTDTYRVDGGSMKMRRAWCRLLQRNGEDYARYAKGGMGWFDGKWGWLYSGAAIVATLVVVVVSVD